MRTRSRLLAVALLVAVTSVVTVVALTRPRVPEPPMRVLADYPIAGVRIAVGVAHTMYFGSNVIAERTFTHPKQREPLTVTVASIRAVVSENTANAKISVLRCLLRTGGAGPLAASRAVARATCERLTPFDSGALTVGFGKGDQDIVVAVTPTRPGTVRLDGVEVAYGEGPLRGRQHTGVSVTTTTHR